MTEDGKDTPLEGRKQAIALSPWEANHNMSIYESDIVKYRVHLVSCT